MFAKTHQKRSTVQEFAKSIEDKTHIADRQEVNRVPRRVCLLNTYVTRLIVAGSARHEMLHPVVRVFLTNVLRFQREILARLICKMQNDASSVYYCAS